MASSVRQIRAQLREFALGLPETHEDLPWGERVVKVKKKVFAFLGRDMDAHFALGVKLGASHQSALGLPFTAPTGYGLGKSGWVSATFEVSAKPSLELLRAWVSESYCAVAPKSLAAQISAPRAQPQKITAAKKPALAKKAPTTKKAATKKEKAPIAKKAKGRAKSVARRTRSEQRAPKR